MACRDESMVRRAIRSSRYRLCISGSIPTAKCHLCLIAVVVNAIASENAGVNSRFGSSAILEGMLRVCEDE